MMRAAQSLMLLAIAGVSGCASTLHTLVPTPTFDVGAHEDEAAAARCRITHVVEERGAIERGSRGRARVHGGGAFIDSGAFTYELRAVRGLYRVIDHFEVVRADGSAVPIPGNLPHWLSADGAGAVALTVGELRERTMMIVTPDRVIEGIELEGVSLVRADDGWLVLGRDRAWNTDVWSVSAEGTVRPRLAIAGVGEGRLLAANGEALAAVLVGQGLDQDRNLLASAVNLVVHSEGTTHRRTLMTGEHAVPHTIIAAGDGWWLVLREPGRPPTWIFWRLASDGRVVGEARARMPAGVLEDVRWEEEELRARLGFGGPDPYWQSIAVLPAPACSPEPPAPCETRHWYHRSAHLGWSTAQWKWTFDPVERTGSLVHFDEEGRALWVAPFPHWTSPRREPFVIGVRAHLLMIEFDRSPEHVHQIVDARDGRTLRRRALPGPLSCVGVSRDRAWFGRLGDSLTLLDEAGDPLWSIEGPHRGCAIGVLPDRLLVASTRGGDLGPIVVYVLSADGRHLLATHTTDATGEELAFLVEDEQVWLGFRDASETRQSLWQLDREGTPVSPVTSAYLPSGTMMMTELGPSFVWEGLDEQGVTPFCAMTEESSQ